MSLSSSDFNVFAVNKGSFAGHPADRERAKELLAKVLRENIKWEDLETAAREHLQKHNYEPKAIEAQVELMQHLPNWLR